MNQRTKTAHDRMVGPQHSDSCGEEHKARHDRQDAADHAQGQQGNAENRPQNMPHVSYYLQLK